MTRESFLIVVTAADGEVTRYGPYETIELGEIALQAAEFKRQELGPWRRGDETAILEPIYTLPRILPAP